jgi:hypothetical protein
VRWQFSFRGQLVFFFELITAFRHAPTLRLASRSTATPREKGVPGKKMAGFSSASMAMRKNTILMPCGGNKGCLTPNEHPSMIGHYSPEAAMRLSPRRRRDIRAPCRIPDDNSQDTVSTDAKIPVFVPKRGLRGSKGKEIGLFSNTNPTMQTPSLQPLSAEADVPRRGLTPDPPMTTYQRDYEIWKRSDMDDTASAARDDKSQTSYKSHVSAQQSLELGSMRSGRSRSTASGGANGDATPGGSPLTARALQHLEAIEEEREKKQKNKEAVQHGELLFGSPRGNIPAPPTTNPQTGQSVRPKHKHLFLPLEDQLKKLIPDFTPVTSAAVSDRSHYIDAKARADKYANERAKASKSESGSETARAWFGGPQKQGVREKDMRVRLVTTKYFRARPIGAENKTGEEILNEIDQARAKRSAAPGPGGAATAGSKPLSTEAMAAAARVREEVRSEKLPPRKLGQRNFASVLNAGWVGEEHVDKAQKSRAPSQGGANYDTQMILSPGLLKARLRAAEERQRRRRGSAIVKAETPAVSPLQKAFTSIQTMSMQVLVYHHDDGQ